MKLKPKITLLDHFTNLTDPRIDRTKDHKLIDILAIAICGMISGADNWVAIDAQAKRLGWSLEKAISYIQEKYGVTNRVEMSIAQLTEMRDYLALVA